MDKFGHVADAYSAASIPRFILIDKQGNIAAYNAPWPCDGEGKEIETLLNREVEKE